VLRRGFFGGSFVHVRLDRGGERMEKEEERRFRPCIAVGVCRCRLRLRDWLSVGGNVDNAMSVWCGDDLLREGGEETSRI